MFLLKRCRNIPSFMDGHIQSDGRFWESFVEQTTKLVFLSSDMNSAFGLTIVFSFNFLKDVIKWIVERNGQQFVIAVPWPRQYSACISALQVLKPDFLTSSALMASFMPRKWEGIDFAKVKGLPISLHGEVCLSSPVHSPCSESLFVLVPDSTNQ